MILRRDDWKIEVRCKEIEKIDDVTIIDYNCDSFYNYEDVLRLLNEFYMTIARESINEDLFSTITDIIEKLNNLKHFKTEYNNDEEHFVNSVLAKFDTFEYKNISEFDMNNGISIVNPKAITEEDISEITASKKATFTERIAPSFIDITNDYMDYFARKVDDGYMEIITCRKKASLISVISDASNKSLVKEYKMVFNKIKSLSKDCYSLKSRYLFDVTRTGFHLEIVYIINSLMTTLLHLLNSSSFNDNQYYMFDRFEIENRTKHFSNMVESAFNVANHQLKQ